MSNFEAPHQHEAIAPFSTLEPCADLVRSSKPYVPRELAALSFESFHFNQGDKDLQENQIAYIIAVERDRIYPEALTASHGIAREMAEAFVNRLDLHASLPFDSSSVVASEMDFLEDVWHTALRNIDPDSEWLTIGKIKDGIIGRDHSYLTRERGRPRTARGESNPAETDISRTHLSQLIHYGLLGRTTYQPIYDRMFQDVTKRVQDGWSTHLYTTWRDSASGSGHLGITGTLVQKLAAVHFDHYPEDYGELSPSWQAQLLVEPTPLVPHQVFPEDTPSD